MNESDRFNMATYFAVGVVTVTVCAELYLVIPEIYHHIIRYWMRYLIVIGGFGFIQLTGYVVVKLFGWIFKKVDKEEES